VFNRKVLKYVTFFERKMNLEKLIKYGLGAAAVIAAGVGIYKGRKRVSTEKLEYINYLEKNKQKWQNILSQINGAKDSLSEKVRVFKFGDEEVIYKEGSNLDEAKELLVNALNEIRGVDDKYRKTFEKRLKNLNDKFPNLKKEDIEEELSEIANNAKKIVSNYKYVIWKLKK